jgi:hypothetical protein
VVVAVVGLQVNLLLLVQAVVQTAITVLTQEMLQLQTQAVEVVAVVLKAQALALVVLVEVES